MVSVGYFATLTGSFGAVKSSGAALEAQGIADVETNRLKLTDYSELDSNVQQGVWQDVPSNPEWQKFITIGPEKAFSGGKQRVADVSIRKKDDVQERFKLQVPLSQANDMVMEDGYIRMANGLIIQYGIVQHQQNSVEETFYFTKPFPHKVFAVNASVYKMSGAAHELNYQCKMKSLSTFTIQSDEGGRQQFSWIAFGY